MSVSQGLQAEVKGGLLGGQKGECWDVSGVAGVSLGKWKGGLSDQSE